MSHIFKRHLLSSFFFWLTTVMYGQSLMVEPIPTAPCIPLYQPEELPNSRHQLAALPADSLARHRIWRCSMPRIYAFMPVPEENRHIAVLLIPGGGYIKQAYEVSGISLAHWLNSIGITAFVLLHRLPNQPELIDPWRAPMQDAQRAMRYIRAHAADYDLDPHRIGVMGTSAGAHFSACLSTLTEDWSQMGDPLDTVSFRPDFAILVSPIINQLQTETAGRRMDDLGMPHTKTWRMLFSIDQSVTSANPPTLLIHAADDPTVPVLGSVAMFQALQRAGVPHCSLHIFPFGKHAIAMRNQPGTTALWPEIAEGWLSEVVGGF